MKIELIKSTLNKITVQNKTQNTTQRYELRNRRDYNNTKTRISDAKSKTFKNKNNIVQRLYNEKRKTKQY